MTYEENIDETPAFKVKRSTCALSAVPRCPSMFELLWLLNMHNPNEKKLKHSTPHRHQRKVNYDKD